MKAICYIISDIDKALSFEWVALKLKDTAGVTFILIGNENTQMQRFLEHNTIPVFVIADQKYPGYFKKFVQMVSLLRMIKPDVVHIHLWRAMLIGLSASTLLRIKKRIFTRHHATIHHDQFRGGLKWDKLCNFLATDIIAISSMIKNILINREGVSESKIHLIPHGFDLNYFRDITVDEVANIRRKYMFPNDAYVIGVISRFTYWKGVQYIIPAFLHFKKQVPNAFLVLANAKGEFAPTLHTMLRELSEDSYRCIDFESKVNALYSSFDQFIHVPVDEYSEAFGQTYVEPLVLGIPSIFTYSGVAPEFIRNEVNALVVPYKDSTAIVDAMLKYYHSPQLAERITTQGKIDVQRFSLDPFIESLNKIYHS